MVGLGLSGGRPTSSGARTLLPLLKVNAWRLRPSPAAMMEEREAARLLRSSAPCLCPKDWGWGRDEAEEEEGEGEGEGEGGGEEETGPSVLVLTLMAAARWERLRARALDERGQGGAGPTEVVKAKGLGGG